MAFSAAGTSPLRSGVTARGAAQHSPPVSSSADAVDDLLAACPRGRDAIVERVLTPLLSQRDQDGDELLLTLREWLRAGRSASRAAERLHCHRNTVRLRLDRLERALGRDLGSASSLLDVEVALVGLEQQQRPA